MWRKAIWLVLLFPQWLLADEIRFSYGAESFLWEEFDGNGASLLDESGFRHRITLDATNRFEQHWMSDFVAHVTFGTVDYDGQDTLGNTVKTDTEYSGYGLEAGFRYFPSGVPTGGGAASGLRLAIGMDRWTRSLQGSGGYDEDYLATYGRVALLHSVPAAWELEFGVKLPIVTSEEVNLSDYGFVETVQLNPKGQPSLYASVDYRFTERVNFTLRYDSYRFARSSDDVVYNTDGNFYAIHQPRSDMQVIGVAVSMSL